MKNFEGKLNKPPPVELFTASILDELTEAVLIIDPEGRILYANQALADFCGSAPSALADGNVWELFPELIETDLEAACCRAMSEQLRGNVDFFFSRCEMLFSIRLLPAPQRLTLIAADITRRTQAETKLESLGLIDSLNARLQETVNESRAMNERLILSDVRQHELTEAAELLNVRLYRAMQESNHRIKNNLQVISALVELESGENDAASGIERLRRISQHIHVLASIYDLLTQRAKENSESDHFDATAILGNLIPMLQITSGGRIIKTEIADISLPANILATLAFLVSECVSNAIKHSSGSIEVTFRAKEGRAYLEVCDDGKGFPPDFNWKIAANTGMSLIDSLTRYDLQGEVRYDNHPGGGGRVVIDFPIL